MMTPEHRDRLGIITSSGSHPEILMTSSESHQEVNKKSQEHLHDMMIASEHQDLIVIMIS